MIKIEKKEYCCGCNACGDICPTNAIDFQTDKEGFWYPVINENKCIGCNKCEKVCPILNQCNKEKNKEKPLCYAAEHKSMEVIFNSTTGGMFSALADVMYNQNGYVGGAIHNPDFSVSEYISNDRNDLKLLRRSKDLQSDAQGFYKKVKDLLEKDNRVLVCALPCQIAALKVFLGKEYDKLITVDLICAGINSPKVWRKYLDYIEEINESKIVWTENKAKEFGWKNLTQKFVFENGKEAFDTHETSLFIQGYVDSHLYCRPSCYECKFKGFPRVGDITIGDYWGITKYTTNHNTDMGTSVVMINSEKGKLFFDQAKKRINSELTPIEWAISGNKALVSSITELSTKRKEFFDDLEIMRFDQVIKKYSVENKLKSGLKHIKKKLKTSIKFIGLIFKTTRLNPVALYQTIKYSGIKNLICNKGIICGTNSKINISRKSNIFIDGILVLGKKNKFPTSRLESRLYIGKNGTLKIIGRFDIDADCEITIFEDAELIIHGGKYGRSDANSGLRILCGEKIEIKSDVGIGRNVMIRDTNGKEHYMNTTGYRPSRPIVIGERAWLCESCTVMPGVKIGDGAIVGVNSVVMKSVPQHALVSGYPAEVIQENVIWKM